MGNPIENATPTVEVIDGPGVLIESEAVAQLQRVAGLAGCVRTVGMPDLHPGPGIPIGMATASVTHVHPALVGSDAGCGVTAAVARKVVPPAKRLRRIERATADPEPVPGDPRQVLEAMWQHGPRGLARIPDIDPALKQWVERVPWSDAHGPSGPLPDELALPEFGRALGTVGGGNHFIELAKVEQVLEQDALEGLRRGGFVVLAHSGSRGLGFALLKRWAGAAIHDPEEVSRYLGELAGCCRFAQANRALLVWRLLEAVGSARTDRIGGCIDLVHNDVSRATNDTPWVHRKGAAPAREGELTITLGSRGSPSWILRGHGDEDHLCSVAHGAGRKIPRNEAKPRLSARYRRADLRRTEGGGQVLCDRSDLLWEEHPDVYKPIEPVVAALEKARVATRVASLVPVVTVKR
ncbi:MAG: RtcB family protein [Myxococcota bacterium]